MYYGKGKKCNSVCEEKKLKKKITNGISNVIGKCWWGSSENLSWYDEVPMTYNIIVLLGLRKTVRGNSNKSK